MTRRRKTTELLMIHCSATPADMDIGAKEINKWHLERGIYSETGLTGYHLIIRRDGTIEPGRPLPVIGAHALGFNDISVGICLVGGARKVEEGEVADWDGFVACNNFTLTQLYSMEASLEFLRKVYPDAAVAPHNAVSHKDCPSFDVWAWVGTDEREKAEEVIARVEEER